MVSIRVLRVVVLTVVALSVGTWSDEVGAEASIGISATATSDPTFWLGDRSFEVVVSNPGTEPLSSVVVTAAPEGPPFPDVVLTDRAVVTGNDDDVLDPGEHWAFEAVIPTTDADIFEVTAVGPDGSPVSAFVLGPGHVYPDSYSYPAEFSITSDVATATAGDQVRWTVSARNIATFPIVDVGDDVGEWRLLHPDRVSGGFASLGAPTDRGDGDDVLSPDETWRWEIDQEVTIDGSFLEVNLSIDRGDLDGELGLVLRVTSAPLAVEPPPTTADPPPTTAPPPTADPPPTTAAPPPPTELPGTGVDRTVVAVALCLLLLGTIAVTAARP